MNSSFLWPQSTMISRGKVKDNISTYLLLLHWNAGEPVPLLSFWHILESSFPPPLNHGKDPWELPVEHFGSKHLVKLVKWRVKEQCRPLGCNQSYATAHRTGDKFEMVVLHVLREAFNIQFNHREGFNDSATSNWVLKLPKLLLNVKKSSRSVLPTWAAWPVPPCGTSSATLHAAQQSRLTPLQSTAEPLRSFITFDEDIMVDINLTSRFGFFIWHQFYSWTSVCTSTVRPSAPWSLPRISAPKSAAKASPVSELAPASSPLSSTDRKPSKIIEVTIEVVWFAAFAYH